MNTTNLFVELIVIGVGAAAWILMLVLAIFGRNSVPTDSALSAAALVPSLSIVYLLGILTDRAGDALFEKAWVPRLRAPLFPDEADYHRAKTDFMLSSDRLAQLLEYGRSRMRICRGWVVNATLAACTLNLLVWLRLRELPYSATLSVVGTIGLLGIAGLSWFSWRASGNRVQQAVRLREENAAALRVSFPDPARNAGLKGTAEQRGSRCQFAP